MCDDAHALGMAEHMLAGHPKSATVAVWLPACLNKPEAAGDMPAAQAQRPKLKAYLEPACDDGHRYEGVG